MSDEKKFPSEPFSAKHDDSGTRANFTPVGEGHDEGHDDAPPLPKLPKGYQEHWTESDRRKREELKAWLEARGATFAYEAVQATTFTVDALHGLMGIIEKTEKPKDA